MKNSASSLNTYAQCPQLWELTYIDKLEGIDADSFESAYGRAYHSLQEGVDDYGSFGTKWQKVIWEHYSAHQNYWKASDKWKKLKLIDREVKFQFEITPGKVVHGIVDGVVELNGEHYLIEYKTTGQNLLDWFQYKEHSIQSGLYLLAAQNAPELQKYNIKGLIFDVTRRCSLKQRRSESDSEYINRCADWWYDNRHDVFARRTITRDTDYLWDVECDILAMFDAQERGYFPKHRDNCYKFRKQCVRYPVCFEGASKSDTKLFQIRKKRS